jgi:hypothetical protein
MGYVEEKQDSIHFEYLVHPQWSRSLVVMVIVHPGCVLPTPAFFLAACDDDTETVSKMLSTAGAQSLINYQHTLGVTPLLAAAANGHESVTKQLLVL